MKRNFTSPIKAAQFSCTCPNRPWTVNTIQPSCNYLIFTSVNMISSKSVFATWYVTKYWFENLHRISTNWKGIGSQLVRFYGPGLFPLVVAIFVDCFAQQLAAKGRKKPVPSPLRCLFQISIIKTALVPEAVTTILDFIESCHLPWWPLPPTDDYIMRMDGLGLPLIYLILGTVAWVIAVILSVVLWLGVLAGGTTMHSLLIRYLRAGLGISALIAELVTLSLTRLPLVVSVVLVAVAFSTCGSVALLLGCVFCIWKVRHLAFLCLGDRLQ